MIDTRSFRAEGNDRGDEYTYRDPHLSLWQSAANVVTTRLESLDLRNRVVRALNSPVHAVHRRAKRILETGEHIFSEIADFTDLAGNCAKLAARFLWAEVTHNKNEGRSNC